MFGGFLGGAGRGRRTGFFSAVLLSATALATVAATTKVAAQTASVQRGFDIPSQSLAQALMIFGRQAGLQVTAEGPLTAGKTSTAVKGDLAAAEALSQLLTATGLTFRFVGNDIQIEAAPPSADGAILLGPVRVEGEGVTYGYAPGETSAFSAVQGFVAKRTATATKTDTALVETPQSISIVTRDAMQARAVTSLRDALEYVPGVTSRSYGEDDRYDWSTYRGFTVSNGAIYRDGLQDGGGLYAMPRSEVYGLERVEVLRGPASILYGNASPGAIVNVVSKRPTPDARGEVNLRLGSRNRLAGGADLSGPVDEGATVQYRVTALAERFDLQRIGVDKDILFVQPSLSFHPGPSTSLTLFAQYQREHIDGQPYPKVLEEYYPERYRGSDHDQPGWDHLYRTQAAGWYVLEHQLGASVLLRSTGRYSDIDYDYQLTNNGALTGPVMARESCTYQDKAHVWAFDNHAQVDWNIGSAITNKSVAGVDIQRKNSRVLFGCANTAALNLDTGEAIGSFVAAPALPSLTSRYPQTGAYLQNQMKIAEQVVLVGGVRHDWYRADESGPRAAAQPPHHDRLSGRAGLVWLHQSGFAPYASYSTSFQPQAGTPFGGGGFNPTIGRQYEVGLRYEPENANARFTAALFDLRRQNVLTPDPDHRNFNIQTGEVASRGIELEANASLAEGLNLIASYTYNKVFVTKDTRPARIGLNQPLVPRHKAAVWADYTLPEAWGPGLNLGLGLRWNSKSWDSNNTLITPATPVLVDARLGYRTGPWDFSINAQNLLNRRYLVSCFNNECYPANRATMTANLFYRW